MVYTEHEQNIVDVLQNQHFHSLVAALFRLCLLFMR